MARSWPEYTWNESARRYRNGAGRFVSRAAVRGALNRVVDAAQADIRAASERLRAGEIDLATWQGQVERHVKTINVASTAVGTGGWAQATPADWGRAGNLIADQYRHLEDFAAELEAGLPLDGRFLARADMYGRSGRRAYYEARHAGDMRAGFDEGLRVLGATTRSCDDCVGYADLGWQPIEDVVIPGDECACTSNCACDIHVRRSSDGTTLLASGGSIMAGKAGIGFDRARCHARNVKASLRGFSAVPVRFAPKPPPPIPQAELVSAIGTLPQSAAAAVGAINRLLGLDGSADPDNPPLAAAGVFIHYPEVGNTNYIGDRYMFLGPSTLRNLARDGQAGIAFMNSHRTGGLSTNAEFPFGRTFAGRYERWRLQDGTTYHRSLMGIYMIRGLHPNGASGPSTDEIDQSIRGGTLFDVSLGLTHDGDAECDVCGESLFARDAESGDLLCPHVPGTHRKMGPEDVAAQEARGVAGGVATYSWVDGHAGEVSAVYDGAVPGAGFKKFVRLARSGRLDSRTTREARDAYVGLVGRSRFARLSSRKGDDGTSIDEEIPMGFRQTLRRAWDEFQAENGGNAEDFLDEITDVRDGSGRDLAPRRGGKRDEDESDPPSPPTTGRRLSASESQEVKRLRTQLSETSRLLEQERQDRQAQAEETRLRDIRSYASQFAERQIKMSRAVPAQKMALVAAYVQAATDDHRNPISGDAGQSRVASLLKLYSDAPQHALFGEKLPVDLEDIGARTLDNGSAEPSWRAEAREQVATILKQNKGRSGQAGGNGVAADLS